eukprot:scaffold64205_cov28-Tisochrysis_lutea.AAC.3
MWERTSHTTRVPHSRRTEVGLMSLLGDACADASIPGLQARWLRGEPDVVDAMKKFAQFTDGAFGLRQR